MSLKDPQYITQALTNVLLMDAVMGCLQTQRSIVAASKLAYFDKIKHEGLTSLFFCFLLFVVLFSCTVNMLLYRSVPFSSCSC